jgi:hypothetical protein
MDKISAEFEGVTVEQVKEALRFCNSYTRLPTLLSYARWLDDANWLVLLGEEWSVCDNVSVYLNDLIDSPLGDCQGGCPIREMMTAEEQTQYDALPDQVTVYRGCYAPNKWGLCWSLSADVALRFPSLIRYRMEGQPLLVKALAKKERIIALKLDREESEIITYRPKHISTRYIRSKVHT